MKLNRTLSDCVYGMAVGDALGVPFEFKPRGSFECTDMVGGGAGEWDKGNGSLMRCLPMAFMECTSAEVRAVSAITHATDACMDACEKMIRYAARLMREGSSAGESAGGPGGSSGYVWDTYNAAIWCLEHTESYKECVLAAVNLGDDTDTTACVAGGLAGILYGREAIPSEWLATLRGKDAIEACLFE